MPKLSSSSSDSTTHQLPDKFHWWEVLGVNPNATPQEVQTAYRKLIQEDHPDVDSSWQARSLAQRINAAYEEYKTSLSS
ncbi:MAG: hypothetical protein BRC44_06820 [Cyanobacteria bacterium QS_4_48_99]|nr:MAG: hypothetical protein BRC44_06820 [Cyanobacteria bacterium QS_4_48_99]